jgi:hypothetical protein
MAVHLDRRQILAGGLALSAGAALAETPSGAPWLTAEPGEAGFADDLAARFDTLIADKRVWGQHGVLVISRGRVVLERYFDGEENNWGKVSAVRFGPTTLHNMYSVTKSIAWRSVNRKSRRQRRRSTSSFPNTPTSSPPTHGGKSLRSATRSR